MKLKLDTKKIYFAMADRGITAAECIHIVNSRVGLLNGMEHR